MKTRKLIPLLVIGIGLLIYYNSLRVGFIFDDAPHIVENLRIRHLWPPGGILAHTARPVVLLSAALNYALGGLNPWGYHVFNIGVHILAALTLYGVARRTLESEAVRSHFDEAAGWLAGLISLLWLVHPLQTESVTYVIQRGESLMGLFYLLTLYCVIRSCGSSRSRGWQMGAVVSCALGMASKPVMVTAPVVVLLYDRAFLAKSWREVMKHRWTLYASLAATWLLLPLLLANGPSEWKESAGFEFRSIPPLQYALTQAGVILHYLRLAFWPHPLCFDYGWEYGWPVARTVEEALPGLMVMGALLTATAWAWWRKPALGFPGVWFFIILAPTSSVVPVADLVVEHRMYLPLAAVVAIVVVGGFTFARDILGAHHQMRRILKWGAAGSCVLLLAILTVQRSRIYESELTLWQDTLDKSPNNPRAYNALGLALAQTGRVREAVGRYEQALRIKPDYAEAHNNLGLALWQGGQGNVPAAIEHYHQALRSQPDNVKAHNNLGIALAQAGRLEEAIGQFDQALRINPDLADVHCNWGRALILLGQVPEAITHYEEAVKIRPDYIEARDQLARLRVLQ